MKRERIECNVCIDLPSKKQYVKHLESELGIENLQQWENVSRNSLSKVKIPPNWK